jgi:hypothetical protein
MDSSVQCSDPSIDFTASKIFRGGEVGLDGEVGCEAAHEYHGLLSGGNVVGCHDGLKQRCEHSLIQEVENCNIWL